MSIANIYISPFYIVNIKYPEQRELHCQRLSHISERCPAHDSTCLLKIIFTLPFHNVLNERRRQNYHITQNSDICHVRVRCNEITTIPSNTSSTIMADLEQPGELHDHGTMESSIINCCGKILRSYSCLMRIYSLLTPRHRQSE